MLQHPGARTMARKHGTLKTPSAGCSVVVNGIFGVTDYTLFSFFMSYASAALESAEKTVSVIDGRSGTRTRHLDL